MKVVIVGGVAVGAAAACGMQVSRGVSRGTVLFDNLTEAIVK